MLAKSVLVRPQDLRPRARALTCPPLLATPLTTGKSHFCRIKTYCILVKYDYVSVVLYYFSGFVISRLINELSKAGMKLIERQKNKKGIVRQNTNNEAK